MTWHLVQDNKAFQNRYQEIPCLSFQTEEKDFMAYETLFALRSESKRKHFRRTSNEHEEKKRWRNDRISKNNKEEKSLLTNLFEFEESIERVSEEKCFFFHLLCCEPAHITGKWKKTFTSRSYEATMMIFIHISSLLFHFLVSAFLPHK